MRSQPDSVFMDRAARDKRIVRLLLLGLILLHLTTNLVWMSATNAAPANYPHNDYPTALNRGLVLVGGYPGELVEWSYDRVRILALDISGSLAVLLGPSFLTLSLASTLALLALILGCFELGRTLRDEWAGLLCAALISFYPICFSFSRLLQGQMFEMAWTVWLVVLAIKLNRALADPADEARGREIGLAALLAGLWPLAFLTPVEMTYVFLFWAVMWLIIGLTLLWALTDALRSSAPRRARRVRIVLLLGIWIAAVTIVLYFPDYVLAGRRLPFDYYGREALGQGDMGVGQAGWRGLLGYPTEMAWETVGLLNVLAVLPALLLLLLLERRVRERWLLAAWLVLPYAALQLSAKKWGIYLATLYPAMAVVTGLGISALRPRALRLAAAILLVLVGATMLQLRSFRIDPFHYPEMIGVRYYHRHPYTHNPGRQPVADMYEHLAGLIQDWLERTPRPPRVLRLGLLKVPGYGTTLLDYYLKLGGERRVSIESALDERTGAMAPLERFDALVVVWPGNLELSSGVLDHQPSFGQVIDPLGRDELLALAAASGEFERDAALGPFVFFVRR